MSTTVTSIGCPHCGGWHAHTCPRIKSIEYHSNGGIKQIVYHDPTTPVPALAVSVLGVNDDLYDGDDEDEL